MKRIALNIFLSLLILLFTYSKSFSKNESGCSAFDILCKVTGKGSDQKSNKKITDDELAKIIEQNEKDIAEADTEINIFGGVFDFSDDKQRAALAGFQHQNDDLYRKNFLGKISPITGGFVTENNAFYLYSGIQSEYDLGFVTVTPSFAPGYYNYGDGKDLGHPLEFKTEVQVSFDLSKSTQMGMSYNHISNASLGTKNPGANSYMFNFLKEF